MSTKVSSITIPNDPVYIESTLAYAHSVSTMAGFSAKERDEIAMALKEACENVITHAFNPFEEESFTVTFEIFCDGLKIMIDEMGIPYSSNIEKKQKYTPGLNAIEANMDRVLYRNRGKQGKELELVKYLRGKHVEEILARDELQPYVSCPIPPADIDFTIRPMKPEEAVQVSRCIYRTYKYTYLNEDLYFPERIEAMNRDGRMHSYVAVTDAGKVVAHFALIPRPNGEVAQIGAAVVNPKYRRKGLMKMLLTRIIEDAGEMNLKALYGDALSMHTMSQRTNLQYGFHETAVQLGELPPGSLKILKEKGLTGAGNIITFFKFIKEPERYDVYLPERHAEMLRGIYRSLGVERSFKSSPSAGAVLPKESGIHLTIDNLHKTANIEILSYGADMERRVLAKLIDLEGKGLNAQYLDLRLKDPYTPEASAAFEELGFIFSGLLPDFSDGDILRLQHYNTELHYAEIETYSLFSTELLNYIKGLDPKWEVLKE